MKHLSLFPLCALRALCALCFIFYRVGAVRRVGVRRPYAARRTNERVTADATSPSSTSPAPSAMRKTISS